MSQLAVRCRDIVDSDVVAVIDLLALGYQDQRDRVFWRAALDRLRDRAVPDGYPRYGCLMEAGGKPVGVILQIFSPVAGSDRVRCNFSSWWVMPEYRAMGSLLVARAFRHKVTYTNITPAPHTLPILEAQGYARYCAGRVIAVPMLALGPRGAVVRRFDPRRDDAVFDDVTRILLADHTAYGCLCFACSYDGVTYPFVFAPRRRLAAVGLAILVYTSRTAPLAQCLPALGRHLAWRGFPLVVIDADAAVPGLPGVFSASKPKYFRGPDRPHIHDHAYTERALFGS